jgi:hypothetical protein
MGSLKRFDIARYRKEYGLYALFETGTFKGDGVRCALGAGFERVYSTEIMAEYVKLNRASFKDDPRVTIFDGHSADVLGKELPMIRGRIFFWLDAHFPGADGGIRPFDAEEQADLRCPLEAELRIIASHRGGQEDVLLLDDLRIYEDGPFTAGGLPPEISRPYDGGIAFVHELFDRTHHVIRIYDDQGYVLLLPKSLPPRMYVNRTMRESFWKLRRSILGTGQRASV